MWLAMAILGVLATLGGAFQIPGVTAAIERFLEPTFEDSVFHGVVPSTGSAYLGLAVGGLTAIAGIGLAYLCYVRRPGLTTRLRVRAGAVHGFLARKWYWDELLDALVYRPTIAAGRFSSSVIERFVVNGLVNGTTGIVRGVGAGVRGAQSGFVRAYALLLVAGFAGLGLYFLVVSS